MLGVESGNKREFETREILGRWWRRRKAAVAAAAAVAEGKKPKREEVLAFGCGRERGGNGRLLGDPKRGVITRR
jgi:hypothetical protein